MTATAAILRADDFGAFRAANRAIAASLAAGLVRNVSVMVPTPHWREARELAARFPDACFGIHATLNCEWSSHRWLPVLGDQVPGLVDADGAFTASPGVLNDRGVDLAQVRAEIRAQIRAAREAGVPVAYLDEHMGCGWPHPPGRPGERIIDLLRELCRLEGLVLAADVPAKSGGIGAPTLDENRIRFERSITEASGAVALFSHPTFADEETLPIRHIGRDEPHGKHAAERLNDARLWTDPETRRWFDAQGTASIRYIDAV